MTVCIDDAFVARPRIDELVERDEQVSPTKVEVKGGVIRERCELRGNLFVEHGLADRAVGSKRDISALRNLSFGAQGI